MLVRPARPAARQDNSRELVLQYVHQEGNRRPPTRNSRHRCFPAGEVAECDLAMFGVHSLFVLEMGEGQMEPP